jgi:flagellar biosynthesis/type III secretory pathway chaperone
MTASTDPLQALLEELRVVLEEERSALLGGGPEQVTAVAARKLQLAAAIERETEGRGEVPAAETLSRLARYNRQNGVICGAILRHMARALDHLQAHEQHRSYLPDGSERERPARHTLGAA